MKREASSPKVDRDAVEGELREILEAIRALIHEVAPQITESMRYGMLDYPGLANLAAHKHYVSLYVAPAVLARHAEAFATLDHGKSCLRFKKRAQLDEGAVRSLLVDVLAERSGA